jgi:hypothetical protein
MGRLRRGVPLQLNSGELIGLRSAHIFAEYRFGPTSYGRGNGVQVGAHIRARAFDHEHEHEHDL